MFKRIKQLLSKLIICGSIPSTKSSTQKIAVIIITDDTKHINKIEKNLNKISASNNVEELNKIVINLNEQKEINTEEIDIKEDIKHSIVENIENNKGDKENDQTDDCVIIMNSDYNDVIKINQTLIGEPESNNNLP